MVLFWFRRDLRLHDNAGFYRALELGLPVQPVFIFDPNILLRLEDRTDARVNFIHAEVTRLKNELEALGSTLWCVYEDPQAAHRRWLSEHPEIEGVYANRDYEPYARNRDAIIEALYRQNSKWFRGAKDHVVFEKSEVVKPDGTPYTVFTPYSRRWRAALEVSEIPNYQTHDLFKNLRKNKVVGDLPSLNSMGFKASRIAIPPRTWTSETLEKYASQRDIPSNAGGTTRLGVHLRFGTLSIRDLLRAGLKSSETFVNELIWRDFYQMVLYHFPESPSKAIKPAYDRIQWETNETHFRAWCEGQTGYPLVDAGMRELNATGYMHNRVRMVAASFLTKHLLLDWRLGEAYFAQKLLDFDQASNVGGWQWASGSGNDAAPYFRIFNPQSQLEKFDRNSIYVLQWVPEYGTDRYPQPIVDHAWARQRCLERYKSGLGNAQD